MAGCTSFFVHLHNPPYFFFNNPSHLDNPLFILFFYTKAIHPSLIGIKYSGGTLNMHLFTRKPPKKLLFALMVFLLYIGISLFTYDFSFGIYQLRIATALYGLSYLFPYLCLPLGLANALTNFASFNGFSLDVMGGLMVGLLTCYSHILLRRKKKSPWFILLTITFIPGFMVPLWLSPLFHQSYLNVVLHLCLGQMVPALIGSLLVQVLISDYSPRFHTKTSF